MPLDSEHAIALACHSGAFTDAVRGLAARVRRKSEELAVTYVVDGDIGRLRVPAQRPSRPAHELWRHTCCEVFVARQGLLAYHEINLSPSGEWAAYAFDGYRTPRMGGANRIELAPHVSIRSSASRLELDAVIRLDRLEASYVHAPLSLALSAVIEDSAGALSYWALRHPAGKPDFHHPQAFALELRG